MKTVLAFVAFIAIAAAQEPEACAVCRQGTGALFASLASEESVAEQIQYIIDVGCPNLEDQAGCAVGIETWWARMAAAVYTDSSAAWTCNALESSCELPSFIQKAWDCDTCVADVQAVSAVGQSPETGAVIVATLQGPAFCQAEDLALDAAQVEDCQGYVARADLAFNLIFEAVGDLARSVICVDLYQICEPQKKLF